MRKSIGLAATALAAATIAGPAAHAGLFDRLLDRSEPAAESKTDSLDRDAASVTKDEQILIAAAIQRGDVGKIVQPVSFQPTLAAPGNAALAPVPEGLPLPPAPAYEGGATPAYPVQGSPVPFPGIPIEGAPYAGPLGPVGPVIPGEGFPLFERVKYEDRDNIHPCATPIVVQVLDPCSDQAQRGPIGRLLHRHDCEPCGPQYVFVEICVPPGCPDIDVSRSGTKVTYDYGDYKVEITSKKGVVYVDYDD